MALKADCFIPKRKVNNMENLEMIVQQQAGLLSWNFEQINESVDAITKRFDGTVYTDEMMADAKKEKASLNKLAKEINQKKIAVKKEYSKPYDLFEKQVKEVIAKINSVSNQIDEQVKAYDEKQKAEKKQTIEAYWNSLETGIEFDKVFDSSWLSKACTKKLWKTELDLKAERFKREFMTIEMITDPEQKIFFETNYKSSHDLSDCMSKWSEYQKIKKLTEEAKKHANTEISEKSEEIPEEIEKPSEIALKQASERVYTRMLNVRGTKDQLNKLAAFMTSIGIEFWGENKRSENA